MITKEQAVRLGEGALRGPIYDTGDSVGRDKNRRPREWRANGKCQTWKTRPGDFRLPIKSGFNSTYQLTHINCAGFTLDENEARRSLPIPLPEVQLPATAYQVTRGGILQITLPTFDKAVGFVADETAKHPQVIREDYDNNGPTVDDTGCEWLIKLVRS